LQSATTPTDSSAIVTVRGDLDTDTAEQLWQYLGYLIGQGHHHIVLDLHGMILIDSAGPGCRRGPAAATWCCGRPARPWPSSWSWPPRRGPPAPSRNWKLTAAARGPQLPLDLVQQLTVAILARSGLRSG
jgi:hypothetical protein